MWFLERLTAWVVYWEAVKILVGYVQLLCGDTFDLKLQSEVLKLDGIEIARNDSRRAPTVSVGLLAALITRLNRIVDHAQYILKLATPPAPLFRGQRVNYSTIYWKFWR